MAINDNYRPGCSLFSCSWAKKVVQRGSLEALGSFPAGLFIGTTCRAPLPFYLFLTPLYRMACRFFLTTFSALLMGLLCSCSSSGTNLASAKVYTQGKVSQVDNAKFYKVRTTAYSHVEADSLKYGRASAEGGDLKYGEYRSAAADWSVFPLGTVFKIEGLPWTYRIDDYGSALVGTKTIDLYKPNMAGISNWGARNVGIKILKWGSYAKSYHILKDRTKASHVRAMVQRIKLRNGRETASL